MPAWRDELRKQRADQRAREHALTTAVTERYQTAWNAIKSELDQLAADAKTAGRVDRLWLIKRLPALEQRVFAEIAYVADYTERKVTAEQIEAVFAGRQSAAQLISTVIGPGPFGSTYPATVPTEALEFMIGRTSAGAPLGELFSRLAPEAATTVRTELVRGLTLSRNPRETGRRIRRHILGGNRARALTIARTETLGAYREATRQTFLANPKVVTGWIWWSALDRRTCPICFAEHGTHHPPEETLGSHPSCRCSMVPETRSWADLGFPGVPDNPLIVEPGETVFARMSPADQRFILGPGKHDAYTAGRIGLKDLVEDTHSHTWGAGKREKSLADALSVAA